VIANIDYAMEHDGTGVLAVKAFKEMEAKKVQKGDVIVAGENFGCGSSREQAPLALKYAEVACIVAGSFARVFFRNAINVGLPIIEAKIDCKEGDIIEIDLGNGIILHEGVKYPAIKLPDFLQEILADGGLVGHRRKVEVDRFIPASISTPERI